MASRKIKWPKLTLAKRMALYSVILSIITLSFLTFLVPSVGVAKEYEKLGAGNGALQAPASVGADARPSTRSMAGAQANQAIASGMIYAPRDVVDMTRLVLETSRDQTTHMAHYIETATTVIVVFFSVLGAVGAAFGMHKIGDIERRAKEITETIENDLGKKITALHREINDQSELLSAKAEINIASGSTFLLKNAARRIKLVLDRNEVSKQARIRGLADYAYAIKRTGDVPDALRHIEEAAVLAKESEPTMFSLIAFNAGCYECILGNRERALVWLKQAIEQHPEYKESAKRDKDFESIWEMPEFAEITK